MTPQRMDSLVNAILHPYRLMEFLGAGAVADVYKAEDITTRQIYAVKVIQTRWLPFPHVMARFESEAQLLFDLQHPYIVKAYPPLAYLELGQGRPYFAIEYLAGGSFNDYMHGGGLLTFGLAVELVAQMASALHYAHQRGVIHRDLKPANILLRDRNSPQSAVLSDFGIAKMMYQTQLTDVINQPGTPEYMAPEQFQSQEATPLSDQYAVGIIMYWMMTRQLPFRISDPIHIGLQHIRSTPPLPSSLNNDITPAVDRVIMQAIAKDPYQRFPDIRHLAYAFAQAVHASHIENMPMNDMSGHLPSTGQGYVPATGVLRMPGPQDEFNSGAGPGVLTPMLTGAANLPYTPETPITSVSPVPAPSGSRLIYAIVGTGGVIAVLLGAILFTLVTQRSSLSLTATSVTAMAALQTQESLAAASTLIPSKTSTATPSVTDTATQTPTSSDTPVATLTNTSPLVIVQPTTAAPSQTLTSSPTASATLTLTETATQTPTSRPTATATLSAIPTLQQRIDPPPTVSTATPVPPLDDLLRMFISEQLGPYTSFDCKLFATTYDALQSQLDQSNPAYEPARSLTDKQDDFAVQIYQTYCLNRTGLIRIDSFIYSGFRNQVKGLLNQ